MTKEIIAPKVVKDYMKRLSGERFTANICQHDVAFGGFHAVGHKGSGVYFNDCSTAGELTEMRLKNEKVVLSLYHMRDAGGHGSYHSQVYLRDGEVTFYRKKNETSCYSLVTKGDENENVAVKLAEALLSRTRKLIG
jgi:hypothetical protein